MIEHMRKRTKRKVYPLVNPIVFAISGAAVTQEQILDDLRMRELTSLEAFRSGSADKNDWQVVNDICNMAEGFVLEGIGVEALPSIRAAQDELLAAHDRYKKTGKMGITGPGLQAFRDVYEYHDLQRTSVARSVYESVLKNVENKIRGKAKVVKFLK